MIFPKDWLILLLLLLFPMGCQKVHDKPVLCNHIPELLFLEDVQITHEKVTLGLYKEDDVLEIIPGHEYKLNNNTMEMPCFNFGIYKNNCIYSKEFEDLKYCGNANP